MVAPLSDVPQEGSSVFPLFSLIKLHLASLPLAGSYSRVAVSSVFWAQNICFSAQTRGAPLSEVMDVQHYRPYEALLLGSHPSLVVFKENQNTPRPSEHPPVRGGKRQNV